MTHKQTCQSIFPFACALLTLGLSAAHTAHGASFTTNNPMTSARHLHTATLLPNGKVLVVGGHNGAALSSAELYDPANGSWISAGTLSTLRWEHTATLLTNGLVLVAGGQNATIALSSAELYNPNTGTWSLTGSMKTNRYFHAATLLPNGKVLVSGGIGTNVYLVGSEIYDPATGVWTNAASLNTARGSHNAIILTNGTVLVAGGYNGVHQSSSETYNPISNAWTFTTGSMTATRYRASATLLNNGKVLMAGGAGSGGWLSSCELYNATTRTWASTGTMTGIHGDENGTMLPNGKVFIAGGYNGTTASAVSETYDPNAGTWSATSSLNAARYFHTQTLLANGKVLVTGGAIAVGFTNSVEVYDWTVGTWAGTNLLSSARFSHTTTLLPNGKALIIGGQGTNGLLASAELYDPTAGTNSVTGPLNIARSNHTATLLGNGKVLIAGGVGTNGILSTAELYDPATGTNTITGSLLAGRKNHSATLLASGKVLIAGGTGASGLTNSAELFDPITGVWIATGSLNTNRELHGATILYNGKVLVSGGQGGSGSIASAELYDPSSGTWANTVSLSTARRSHSSTLLPNGRVLVAGGYNASVLASAELYDPVAPGWTNTTSLFAPRGLHSAILLPNGRVLVAGGSSNQVDAIFTTELYDPANRLWFTNAPLTTRRHSQNLVLLPNGKILISGGYNGTNALASAELYDPGLALPAVGIPQISSITAPLTIGASLTITGSVFRGISEASCGNGQDSATDYPLLQLRAMDQGQTAFILSTNWTTNLFVSLPVTNLPAGYALATVFVNGAPSTSSIIQIVKPSASLSFGSLAQTYDGSARAVSYSTTPSSLSVYVTYNGTANPPTNAGSYTVVGVVNEDAYQGAATNTLVVAKANATVSLESLSPTFDATAKSATATTAPNGLAVNFTYDGSPNPPTNAGSYTVVGTISDINYQGSATNTLVISPVTATVTLGSLSQIYDGTARAATATTTPNGLSVLFAYDGSPAAPTNAGSYTVVGVISDPNYQGSATNTLVVSKAAANVTLGNLAQIYDGTARIASASTIPIGLLVTLSYNGSPNAPTNVGSYTVVGVVNDANYLGSATNTLVISKAAATVVLGDLLQTYDGSPKIVSAATTPSGLAVDITYDGSVNAPTNAGSYAAVGVINDANYQGGVTNTLVIGKAAGTVAFSNLSQIYDGSAKSVSATTTPSGLAVDLAYDGSALPPTNAGSYTVIGTIDDQNYQGAGTNTLTVAKAAAAVAIAGLSHTYDGSSKSASATTTPSGLAVTITYNGSVNPPTNAGSYTVIGTVSDLNYQGNATNTLVINKANATIAFTNLTQPYDGTARIVSAITIPSGLPVNVTYNNSANAPTNVGSYTVVGSISAANYQGAATNTLVVSRATAIVALGSLSQTYDGSARLVVATTTPPGLVVDLTYDGAASAPTNAGTYSVVGTVNDANYAGSATNTLAVAKAAATVTLGNLNQTFDGAAKAVSVSTSPTNLAVNLSYSGAPVVPTNASTYTVVGTIAELNYAGTATNSLVINQASATVSLANLSHVYDGTAKSASASTTPNGLAVILTYNGSVNPPTNSGSYTVIGTVSHANYVGSATNILVISGATGVVNLVNLSQTYDGTARAAGATTTPSGLTVLFTYDGSAAAPTNASSYIVVGNISDPNYQGSATNTLVVGKALASVTLGALSQTYDGSARVATATTTPSGLSVNLTYNGLSNPPTNAGSYTVVGSVNDINYQGSATNTLVVSPAAATVTLANLAQIYDGAARIVSATTTPNGLAVLFSYNGSPNAPTNAGSYSVTGTINELNYQGSATNTLIVSKGSAVVTLANLSQTFDGTARPVTAITTPSGLTVTFTYAGAASAPTNAGSYLVIGTITDANYQGSATNTLVIGKAGGSVLLGGLSQTYDGTPRIATATTTPAGLTVDLAYDGSPTPPTNAGSYTIVGTINDVNYQGAATNTLAVTKASATVALNNLTQTYDGTARSISATTAPPGLTVLFTYDGLNQAPTNVGNYTVIGSISDVNYQGAATNTLVVAKASATVTLANLSQTYDGTGRSATATTAPGSLLVNFTYDGSVAPPTNAASYIVIGTVNDNNYQGAATNTLVIGKASAVVTLGSLSQPYDGNARPATASTVPSGLSVSLTYDSSPSAPTNVGFYSVVGTVNDLNYTGSATNTLTIFQGTGGVTLGNLSQIYDGGPRTVTATTTPLGLTVTLTYNGSSNAPTNAGNYTVIGAISDANYQGAATNTLVVGKASATVTLGNLSPTYDGTAKTATATTVPSGLTVNFTYNGTSVPPTNAGSYVVVGTVSSANYDGAGTNTLVIAKATAAVSLANLSQTYDGTARLVTPSTIPGSLPVSVTYNGSPNPPTNAGSYTVFGLVNHANYQGGTTNSLVVNPAAATVTLGNLSQIYDGTAKSVTASTSPSGLPVNVTYNGSANPPTNVGAYTVIGTIVHTNYQGSATNTLAIEQAPGTVIIGNLAQTHNGAARAVTVSTVPTNLTVNVTYNGLSAPPTNAGNYTVIATINDAVYSGSATNTLIVAKAAGTVTLANLSQTYDGNAHSVTATTTPSGLGVSFTYNGSVNAPTNAGNYTVIGSIADSNYQGSGSNTLVIAKIAGTISLSSLAHTYDGNGHPATASTTPSGLGVAFTYNGSSAIPTNGGNYTVIGSINDVNYQGSATNTLVIGKAAGTVLLGSLSQTYTGTARNATATTVPAGMAVTFTYNGSATAPVNVGNYVVVGSINNVNYQGSATNTLVVNKAVATVTLGSLFQAYNGLPRTVTVTTVPSGLPVSVTYDGTTNAPVNAGSHSVIALVNHANYSGGATNILVIDQATVTVAFTNMPPVTDAAATLLPNNRVLLAGGQTPSGPTNRTALYDSTTGAWIPVGSLLAARFHHTMTLLPNGKVLAAGGNNAGAQISSAEIFDPLTGNWSTAGSLSVVRSRHTATLLSDGRVFVVGGITNASSSNLADIYDAASASWSTASAPSVRRSQHTATRLSDGRILVVGGEDANGNPLSSAEIFAPAGTTWTPTGSLASARRNHTATLLPNGKVLVVGGRDGSGEVAVVELFDPNVGTWTNASPLTYARENHSATLLPNGQLLIAGGSGSGGWLNSLELYDPVTNNWVANGLLTVARAGHTATLLANGSVVIAGGQGSGGILPSSELFSNPADSWMTGASMIVGTFEGAATLMPNGKVIFTGGQNSTGWHEFRAEVYDPISNSWALSTPMIYDRQMHTSTLLPNGKIIIAGGYRGVTLHSAELYDPATGTYSVDNAMQQSRHAHTATLLANGKLLLAGGSISVASLASAELYNPATGIWTLTGTMHYWRSFHTATLMPSGHVLVTGGYYSSTAETYDPGTAVWSETGPLTMQRSRHTATLLPDGTVLVAGGAPDAFSNTTYTDTEIFNPGSRMWTAGPPMAVSRKSHTATLLPNGKVIVVGGEGASFTSISSVEVYDPVTRIWTTGRPLAFARSRHTATLLPNGKLLVAGGTADIYYGGIPSSTELYDLGTVLSSAAQPLITTNTSPIRSGGSVSVTGSGFRGISGASGGNSKDSPGDFPVVQLRRVDSEQSVFLLSTNWSTNTFSSASGFDLPPGHALLTVYANGIPSASRFVLITNKAPATVSLTNLLNTYDGTPHAASVSTVPPGLNVVVTYDGWTNLPVNGGNYLVSATISDPNYQGNGSATLVVQKIPGTVTQSNLVQVYDGTYKTITTSTTPTNFAVYTEYNGSFYPPIEIGTYTAFSTITDPNYYGSITNIFTILIPFQATNVTSASSGTYYPYSEETPTVISAVPTNSGQAGVSASIVNVGGDMIRVIVAGYATSPPDVPVFGAGSSYVDIRVTGADASDLLTANFYYPSTLAGAAESSVALNYWDGLDWTPVRGTNGSLPIKDTTDNLNGTVSGGRFRVVFGATSTPVITALTGTVFVLAPMNLPPSPVITQASLQGNGAFQFAFTNLPGTTFSVYGATNLSLPFSNWTFLGSMTEGPPGQFHFTDPQATNSPRRFYRARFP